MAAQSYAERLNPSCRGMEWPERSKPHPDLDDDDNATVMQKPALTSAVWLACEQMKENLVLSIEISDMAHIT